jgi:hypothetical protein
MGKRPELCLTVGLPEGLGHLAVNRCDSGGERAASVGTSRAVLPQNGRADCSGVQDLGTLLRSCETTPAGVAKRLPHVPETDSTEAGRNSTTAAFVSEVIGAKRRAATDNGASGKRVRRREMKNTCWPSPKVVRRIAFQGATAISPHSPGGRFTPWYPTHRSCEPAWPTRTHSPS